MWRAQSAAHAAADHVDWTAAIAAMVGSLVALMALGLPVVFAFLVVGGVAALLVLPDAVGLTLLARTMVAGLKQFILVPIPLFLLIGNILVEGGAAQRALSAIDAVLVTNRNRRSHVALIGGIAIAGVSGSSLASAALLGRTLVPPAITAGAAPGPVVGPVLAAGGIAMLIPPSALGVLVASLAGVDVGYFLLAMLPVGVGLFVAYLVVIRVAWAPESADAIGRRPPVRGRAAAKLLVRTVGPLVAVFAATVGGFALGLATPTEAAALGVWASLLVVALGGEISINMLRRTLLRTACDSGALLILVAVAGTFSQLLVFTGVTAGIRELVGGIAWGPTIGLAAMMLVAVVLGCLVDGVSIILITLPLFLPLSAELGISPVLMCMAMLLAIEIGLITPPFGLLLFTARIFAPDSMSNFDIVRCVLPFLVADVIVLLMLVACGPVLATWLAG